MLDMPVPKDTHDGEDVFLGNEFEDENGCQDFAGDIDFPAGDVWSDIPSEGDWYDDDDEYSEY